MCLGISLPSKFLKQLRTPFIDATSNVLDLMFISYQSLSPQMLSSYELASTHFWGQTVVDETTRNGSLARLA